MAGLTRAGAELTLLLMKAQIPNALVLTVKSDAELAVLAVKHGVDLKPEHILLLPPPPEPPSPQWSPLQSPSAVLEDNSWLLMGTRAAQENGVPSFALASGASEAAAFSR